MYDVRSKTVPKNLDKLAKISTKDHYNTRLSAKKCFSVKFSRTAKWESLLLELVCLFGILFHFLLRLSTYIIFVKNKITTPCSRKGLSTNCCFSVFVCLFCFALLAIFSQREFRTNTNRPSPSEKKLSLSNPRPFLWKTNFICMRMKNHFDINDYALSLALKQRLGTIRKWLIEIVTLLFIGYDEVA